jgi:hypothetical protein
MMAKCSTASPGRRSPLATSAPQGGHHLRPFEDLVMYPLTMVLGTMLE